MSFVLHCSTVQAAAARWEQGAEIKDGALVALGIFPSPKYHIEAGPIGSIGIRAEKKVSIFLRCAVGEPYQPST